MSMSKSPIKRDFSEEKGKKKTNKNLEKIRLASRASDQPASELLLGHKNRPSPETLSSISKQTI